MPISAKIITDSISAEGKRLTTFEVECHRWILAEINTHRMLSRNYRSSRAVPVAKLIQEVRENPATPVAWMKNKPGMVATEPMTDEEAGLAESIWRDAAKGAAAKAAFLSDVTLMHKQWVNRILEPYLFVHGVISATDWNNFFALRRAPDAQPEFKALADAMYTAFMDSTPRQLKPGEWHLPYANEFNDLLAEYGAERLALMTGEDSLTLAIKCSVARVARVSIKPFDADSIDIEKDLALYDRLLSQKHMSPFEHQATPDQYQSRDDYWFNKEQWGNFSGWIQYRKTIPDEYVPG